MKKTIPHTRFTKLQRRQVFQDFLCLMSEASDPLCPHQYDSYIILKNIRDLSKSMMQTLQEKDLVKGARWEA
jgi:hypothetical protein|tara:strand:- start:639 stop:854 length:216 start_codon:yes stop_codon:yes gene_type:complete